MALAWCLPAAVAQDAAHAGGGVPYLLRLERLQRGEDTCVLVRGDGQYHLEVLNVDKTLIYEGYIDADDLRQLERNLSKDALFRLQQSEIHAALIHWELDDLSLSILRPGRWQNLHFPDADSRHPYDALLDPLLEFLKYVQKKKGQPFNEETARNNCLPPTEIRLKTRGNEGTAAPKAPGYILRVSTSHLTGRQVENICTIVFPDGMYHHVRRSQEFRSKEVRAAVEDAQLAQDQMSALRRILEADGLKKYSTNKTPSRGMGEGSVTSLSIPRGSGVQEIVMWKYFDLNRWGAGAMPGSNEHGMKVLKPLNDWLKANVADTGEKQVPDPPNPQCSPQT